MYALAIHGGAGALPRVQFTAAREDAYRHGLMQALAKVPNVRLAAVCDIWDVHVDLARKIAGPSATSQNTDEPLARPARKSASRDPGPACGFVPCV